MSTVRGGKAGHAQGRAPAGKAGVSARTSGPPAAKSRAATPTGAAARRKAAPLAAPAAAAALRLDQQVCFPLYAAAHLVTRLYRPLLEPLGLTYPQYLALLVLWEQSPASVGELGQRLLLDSGTLTPLLKRLEAAGLVTRSRCSQDERRVLVDLTPAGRRLRQRASGIPAAMCAHLGVEPRDLLQLRDALQRLVGELSAPHPPVPASTAEPPAGAG